MLDSGVYSKLHISNKSPISRSPITGDVAASQSAFRRTGSGPSSSLSAAMAPTTVCLRARSAWRASVDDSCSMMRPSCCVTIDTEEELSPMAMPPRALPKRRSMLSRIYEEGSVERTQRNKRRIALFLAMSRSMRLLKALRRRSSRVPSRVYCKISAMFVAMTPAFANLRLQSRAVIERML